jgi:hypothetical protein
MRTYTLYSFLCLLLCLGWQKQAAAQCPLDNTNYGTFQVPNAGDVQSTPNAWGGDEYYLDVVAGTSYTISTCSSNSFDSQLTLYEFGTGTLIAFNDDFCGLQSEITFTATYTGQVIILLDEFDCGPDNVIDMELVVTNNGSGGPANDDCAGAFALTPAAGCVFTAGSTLGATLSNVPACGGDPSDDVWFSFVANATDMNVNVAGATDFDAVVEVFSGNCSGLASIACEDATLAGEAEAVILTGLIPGDTYFVRVYDFFAAPSTTPTFDICVRGTGVVAPPANDACDMFEVLTQQGAGSCFTTLGTVAGASGSGTPGCSGTAEDDVWYSFVATNVEAEINVLGGLDFDAVIEWTEADCTTSLGCADATIEGEQETLTLTGLTIGQSYRFRIYDFYGTAPTDPTFEVCVTTPAIVVPCSSPTPICTSNGLNYQANATGVIEPGQASSCGIAGTGNDYGCLCSQPDPTWFYLEIDQSGPITFDMAAASDIDFALWGPFPNLAAAQAGCGTLPVPIDCSFSGAATETVTIPAAVSGEVYILLITNYANVIQIITANQTGGTGTTNCNIVIPCAANAGGW